MFLEPTVTATYSIDGWDRVSQAAARKLSLFAWFLDSIYSAVASDNCQVSRISIAEFVIIEAWNPQSTNKTFVSSAVPQAMV